MEVLVRPGDVGTGDPPAVLQAAEEREIRGAPVTIAAELRRFADLGIDHHQVQLRPNCLESVLAFSPVIKALRGGG